MSLIISNVTIINGVEDKPIEGKSIVIESGRIKSITGRDEMRLSPGTEEIDAHGKYVSPGLMNANVHLLCDIRLENLARHMDHFEDLIAESAQVALKNGLTTVFDTCGPRRFLMSVRDQINAGTRPGSRIFCAGNIVGFDGPFSGDFFAKAAEVASAAIINRINAIWVENVGRRLMWLTPKQVAKEVHEYIAKGIDFLKYGANDHFPAGAGAFLVFSPESQAAIVEEVHRAGITAQAHTMSVEGLRIAVEAGCDLIQHANITGPVPIPETTLERMVERRTGAVVFPFTERGFDWLMKNASDMEHTVWQASDINARNLVQCGAPLLLANDGALFASESVTDPLSSKGWASAPAEDSLGSLASGHFYWFKAMEEKGCHPMEMLKAATRNIAVAYGKDQDLGTLEPGKIADMLILDKNPLLAAENYRSIHMILKDGAVVDRDALPVNPILTKPVEPPAPEEAAYIPFLSTRKIPMCPMCMSR